MTFLRFAASFLLLLCLVIGAVACGKEEPAPAAPAPPTNTTASVAGQLSLPPGIESHSIMVFAEGTSFMALSDSKGRFEISGLKPGSYTVRAARPDLQSIEVGSVEITTSDLALPQPFFSFPVVMVEALDPSQYGAAQFASRTRGIVRGKVVTQFPGDEVGILVEATNAAYKTRTLEDGSFEIINVEPGTYTIQVSRPAYQPAILDVTIAAGDVQDLGEIRLASGLDGASEETEVAVADRVVFGTVEMLLSDGTIPSDFTSVRVVLEGTAYSATPDPTGRFRIGELPPGVYQVAASQTGFLLERKIPVDLRSLVASEVKLVLLEDTTAVDSAGSVVGKVTFDRPPASGSAAGISVVIPGTSLSGYTDAQGFYSILNVPEGPHDLLASFAGYKPATATVTVRGGNPVEVPDLLLERDVERPEVVYTNPVDGGRDVTIVEPTVITIQFSMAMNAQSVRNAITITPEVGFRVVAVGGSGGAGGDAYSLQLDALPKGNKPPLRFGTQYRVNVAKTAMSVEGETMAEPYSFRFTTGFPEVIGSDPADGDSDVRLRYDNPIAFYFNAAIDQESVSIDDIDISPQLPAGKGQIYFRRDPKTGWTILYFAAISDWDTNYRLTIDKGAETITGERVRNLPYRINFRSSRKIEFDEKYGIRPPTYDEREREDQRSRNR